MPAYTRHEIEWIIPLSRGWAEIHAARVLDGVPMIWPRLEDSKLGRWWLKLMKRLGR